MSMGARNLANSCLQRHDTKYQKGKKHDQKYFKDHIATVSGAYNIRNDPKRSTIKKINQTLGVYSP